ARHRPAPPRPRQAARLASSDKERPLPASACAAGRMAAPGTARRAIGLSRGRGCCAPGTWPWDPEGVRRRGG
ncbi:MAG TPA: hypothetical protein VH682_06460, partial [Gemmataceae bacterium]